MSNDEISVITELAWHQYVQGQAIQAPWSLFEQVSGWKIDRNITVGDLGSQGLPKSIWIECTGTPPTKCSPWIAKTVGFLISELPLFDASKEALSSLIRHSSSDTDYEMDLMRALAMTVIGGAPCLGYRIIIVQQTGNTFRYVHTLLGHEQRAELIDVLRLQHETMNNVAHKFKETELAWSNIGIRLMLLLAQLNACTDVESAVSLPEDALADCTQKNYAFFMQKHGDTRKVAVKPEYKQPFEPFRIEPTS